ncbi:methylated-DNA--[protein]-cysteine S-methyltransferase [Gordonia westfalica]|uniref:Methylated-DNA--protein-cysteine methyltransferase n=1 Tax=Gordonia westfalica TaxID=158898 RepID=A0A1H2GQ57_9ACTN|nr:methylated-DNA--[protein]-cysteine S-methyltransferase [Gordonia westfalica]SDU21592.1 methylated-DNA-[protein]-cysteine S-methyltransferase [Gordonia westfalica]
MTSAQDRDAGSTTSLSMPTPVGSITVTGNGRAIIRVAWRETAEAMECAPADPALADPLLAEAVRQLRAYFDGELTSFDLPIALPDVSDSARAVLTALHRDVPFGSTVTYGQLATMSGTTVPARSVGTIMGINPVPLLIPCHRVVAGDGLGGYSGGPAGEGLTTKRRLLEFEGALPPTLF